VPPLQTVYSAIDRVNGFWQIVQINTEIETDIAEIGKTLTYYPMKPKSSFIV
jgi:hypothetical protein